eukprot:SAG22_NODE_3749_length_1546_cov_2.126469_3_plen_86_part_01
MPFHAVLHNTPELGLADDRVLFGDVPANIAARLERPDGWLREQLVSSKALAVCSASTGVHRTRSFSCRFHTNTPTGGSTGVRCAEA